MVGLLAAMASVAQAGERADWETLQDDLLRESMEGDLYEAHRRYVQLTRELPDGNPTRAEALYWLGRTRRAMGDATGAREALRECVRSRDVSAACLDLLGDMEIERTAIREIPVKWTFSPDTQHGFVHPWAYAEKGVIAVRQSEVLSWTINVDANKTDRLLVGFRDPTPQPRGVRFRAQSVVLQTHLSLQVFDVDGNRFTLPLPVSVPVGTFIDVAMDFRAVVNAEGGPERFAPSRIDLMMIEDVTGEYGGTGENEILIDDFEVY